MKYIKPILIYLLFLCTIGFSQQKQDIVTLKNGDVIKGEIIENAINKYVKVKLLGGSILTYQYKDIEKFNKEDLPSNTISNFQSFGQTQTFGQQQTVGQSKNDYRDCYNDGYFAGTSVSTSGAWTGGFAGGFLGGVIGWVIAYSVVSGKDVSPPYYEMSQLGGSCKTDYMRGYSIGADKARKRAVNTGAGIGTLLILLLVLTPAS